MPKLTRGEVLAALICAGVLVLSQDRVPRPYLWSPPGSQAASLRTAPGWQSSFAEEVFPPPEFYFLINVAPFGNRLLLGAPSQFSHHLLLACSPPYPSFLSA